MKKAFLYRLVLCGLLLSCSFMLKAQMPGQQPGRQPRQGGLQGEYDPGMRPDMKEKPSAEEVAKMQTGLMKRKLDLTPDQEKSVAAINLKYAKEYEEQMKSTPEVTDYTKAVLEKIRLNQETDLKKVLTETQWNTFKKLQEERKKQVTPGQGRP